MAVKTKIKLSGPVLAFVTTTVRNWSPVFSDRLLAEIVVMQLRESIEYFKVSLAGYVLMPSHLHAMIGLEMAEMLPRFMQSFKILSSKTLKNTLGPSIKQKFMKGDKFRFWMPRYDDFVITTEKQFRRKLEYVHNNPVKAGLVGDAVDYKFSSASAWLGDKPGLINIDKDYSWCRES